MINNIQELKFKGLQLVQKTGAETIARTDRQGMIAIT